jgi:hypothetical protein
MLFQPVTSKHFTALMKKGKQPQLHQARRVDMTAQPTPVMDTPAAAASMVAAGSAALMDEEQYQQLSGMVACKCCLDESRHFGRSGWKARQTLRI